MVKWEREFFPTPPFILLKPSTDWTIFLIQAVISSKTPSQTHPDSVWPSIWAGFPNILVGKESTSNTEDPSWIPGSRRSAGEEIGYTLQYSWASLVTQLVKNPLAMPGTWVWSLGWEDDPLEKGKATYSSILSWRIPKGHKELEKTEELSLSSIWAQSQIDQINHHHM